MEDSLKTTDFETNLAGKLRKCCTPLGDEIDSMLAESSEILMQMGKLYLEKAISTDDMLQKLNFIKCAALLHGARIRFQTFLNNPGKVSEVNKLLDMLDYALRKASGARTTDERIIDISKNISKQLKTMREKQRSEIQKLEMIEENLSETELFLKRERKTEDIQEILQESTKNYKNLMHQISEKCIELLGNAPCKFSLVGLGSLARSEITLYSDFEHVILLEEQNSQNYDDVRKYFRWYSVVFQVIIIGLGETFIRSVGVRCINDLYSGEKSKNWFYDMFTPCGISFDGRVPHSCNIPLGRQEPTIKRKHVVELIQPPSIMANYLTYDEHIKNGYYLKDILSNTCFVSGEERIHEVFRQCRNDKIWKENTSEIVAEKIRSLDDNQNQFLNGIRRQAQYRDMKNMLYRPITTVVAYFARIFHLTEGSTFDLIQNIKKVDTDGFYLIFSHNEENKKNLYHNLRYAVTVACEVRLKVYSDSASQRKKISRNLFTGFVNKSCLSHCYLMSKKTKGAISLFGKLFCNVPLLRQELKRVTIEKLKSDCGRKFEPYLSGEPLVIGNEGGPTAETLPELKEEGRQIIEKLCIRISRQMPLNEQEKQEKLTSDHGGNPDFSYNPLAEAEYMMQMGFVEKAIQIFEKSIPDKDVSKSCILLQELAQVYVQHAFQHEHLRDEYLKKAENVYITLKQANTDLIMPISAPCHHICHIYFHQKRYKECFQFAEEVFQGLDQNYHYSTATVENLDFVSEFQAKSALQFMPHDQVIAHCKNVLSKKPSVLLRIKLGIIVAVAQIRQGDKKTARKAIQGLVKDCELEAQELGGHRTIEILNKVMDIQQTHKWHKDMSEAVKLKLLIGTSQLGPEPHIITYPQETKSMIRTALQSMVEYKQANNMAECKEQYNIGLKELLTSHESVKYLANCAELLAQAPKMIQNDTGLRRDLFIVLQTYLSINISISKIFSNFKIVITSFSDLLTHPAYYILLRNIFLSAIEHERQIEQKLKTSAACLWKSISEAENRNASKLKEDAIHLLCISITKRRIAACLWKSIFEAENRNASKLKEDAIHLLFISITKRRILELKDCIGDQLHYFVKKQSLPPLNNTADKYNYAVECYAESKFKSCATALWEIISREKKDLFIKRRSITMMFHLILSKIDVFGKYLEISGNFIIVGKQYLIDQSCVEGWGEIHEMFSSSTLNLDKHPNHD